MTYRKLTPAEINALKANSCRCNDWNLIEVADPFRPEHYSYVTFSGRVCLGTTDSVVVRDGMIPMAAGIYDATIHDCEIGNDVLIKRIGNYIAN